MKRLSDEELEVTTGCAAAHPDRMGGQHVAMQCPGVRIMHVPSGIAVTVMHERSQIKNKAKALALLQRLLEPSDLSADEVEALDVARHLIRGCLLLDGAAMAVASLIERRLYSQCNQAIAVLDRLLLTLAAK